MNQWNVEFVKMLKRRDNKSKIGNVVGTVIAGLPNMQISILDGNAILDNEDLYVCNSLILSPVEDSFSKGDKLLLSPDEAENKWFVIDKVTKL